MISNKFLTIIITKDLFINIMKENCQKYFQNFLNLLKHLIETKFSGSQDENLIHTSDVYDCIVSSFYSTSRSISIKVFSSTLLVNICHFMIHKVQSILRFIQFLLQIFDLLVKFSIPRWITIVYFIEIISSLDAKLSNKKISTKASKIILNLKENLLIFLRNFSMHFKGFLESII